MKFTALLGLVVIATTALFAHDPITTKVTWEREIAPLFEARCISCHAPGGGAPMSLATYDEARPWARAIREEVLARRMPRWPVVRGYGDFENDPSLSAFEIALITAWVDGGAPKTLPNRTGAPAPSLAALPTPRLHAPAEGGKTVSIACRSQALPSGRLLSITPALRAGGSLRLILQLSDGRAEPLIWIRNFDPAFDQTYHLRTPVRLTRGTRLVAETEEREGCRVSLTLEAS
jgi:hypothetical protein